MSNQLITTSAGGVGLRVGSNINTADINVMPEQTSGALRLGVSSGRTGGILVGNPSASGFLTIDSGSGGLNLLGTGTVNVGTSGSRTNPINVGSATDSGTFTINSGSGDLTMLSTGTTSIATAGSRGNPINVGNASDTAAITVNAGSGALSLLSTGATNVATAGSRTGIISLGSATDSANIELDAGSASVVVEGTTGIQLSTTGAIAVGAAARGTAMTIGTATDTADITIDAGSAAVNVRGANGLRADDGISFDGGTTTLSSYLTGTWTPVIEGATGNMTLGTATGRYTQIGNVVHVMADVPWTAVGSATGDLKVTGLPVTSANVDVKVPIVIEGTNITEAGVTTVGNLASGSTEVLLEYVQNSSSVTGNIAIGDMSATGTLYLNISYQA